MAKTGMVIGLIAILAAIGFGIYGVSAAEQPVVFTEEYLNDPEVFKQGKEIWFEQCVHCHGYNAYPGKAPKLKPKRYKPEFVYKRVAKGFKKMPAWEDVYEKEELMAVVAYVKSKNFSP